MLVSFKAARAATLLHSPANVPRGEAMEIEPFLLKLSQHLSSLTVCADSLGLMLGSFSQGAPLSGSSITL